MESLQATPTPEAIPALIPGPPEAPIAAVAAPVERKTEVLPIYPDLPSPQNIGVGIGILLLLQHVG